MFLTAATLHILSIPTVLGAVTSNLILQFKHCLDEDWGSEIRHISIVVLELI